MSGYFGRGEAIGHAGEILQGAVRREGRVEPFLVTLPMPAYRSTATACPAEEWRVTPAWKTKALEAAQLAWGGPGALTLAIDSDIAVGRGCGSSTADCVAAVRAVGDLMGVNWTPETTARLVQRAEGASDATMFGSEPVAFLPRAGQLLRRLGAAWPAMEIAVHDLGGPMVETLACPVPAYTGAELDEFEALLAALERAIAAEDVPAIGGIALRSGEIHQRHRRHEGWVDICRKAAARGAAGVAFAHSGTVAAVLTAAEGKGNWNADSTRGRR
ncbi:MAG TPA: hypothetical protein VFQ91_12630 [Bryobacteraceae bacterium]|nr:hypothetical protein [Bryobacteraceae bacterium]